VDIQSNDTDLNIINELATKHKLIQSDDERMRVTVAAFTYMNTHIFDFMNNLHIFCDTYEHEIKNTDLNNDCIENNDTQTKVTVVSNICENVVKDVKSCYATASELRPDLLKSDINIKTKIVQSDNTIKIQFDYMYYCYNFRDVCHIQEKIEDAFKTSITLN
jgi:hypothetical protein